MKRTLLLPALLALCWFEAGAAPVCSGRAPAGELKAERVAAVAPTRPGAGLYEGPVWAGGALYFSDFGFEAGFPSRIRRLTPDGKVETVVEDSGSNGMAVDAGGKLVVASHKDKTVMRMTLGPSGAVRTRLAEGYRGQPFNSPNDVALGPDGAVWFTDPDYQKAAAPGGQPLTGVYRIGANGDVTLVDGSLRQPNGIALAPGGETLYVGAGDGVLRAYPLVDGMPGKPRELVKGLDGPDGMTVDCHGNLYVTEHGAKRLRVFSPQGRQLALIQVDANVTNAAFGGPDGKTLYITGAGAVWQLRLDVSGAPY